MFQLVEFGRNLTSLLEKHLGASPDARIKTSFPTASQTQQTEADWARQRAAFDENSDEEVLDDCISENGSKGRTSPTGGLSAVGKMSIGDMKREAEELDEAMRQRRMRI